MDEELWRNILEFPLYDVSNHGRICNNRNERIMSISYTATGHSKITLTGYDGGRYTRSVALLVADAFVKPPNILCDQIILLDGDFSNVRADNIAWRPGWFSWKYTRQLKVDHPRHYYNLPVLNTEEDIEYPSIIDAGIAEGLLFDDIWKSTYQKIPVFPHGVVFEIL